MRARETCFAALVRSRNRRDGRASTGAGFAGAHDERAHGRSAPQGLGGNVACKSHSLPGQVEPRTLPPLPAPPLRALTAAPKPRLLAMPISRLAGLTPSLPPSRPPPSEARLFLDGTGAPLSWRNVWLVPSSKPAESRSAQLATSADALPSLAPPSFDPLEAPARDCRAHRETGGDCLRVDVAPARLAWRACQTRPAARTVSCPPCGKHTVLCGRQCGRH